MRSEKGSWVKSGGEWMAYGKHIEIRIGRSCEWMVNMDGGMGTGVSSEGRWKKIRMGQKKDAKGQYICRCVLMGSQNYPTSIAYINSLLKLYMIFYSEALRNLKDFSKVKQLLTKWNERTFQSTSQEFTIPHLLRFKSNIKFSFTEQVNWEREKNVLIRLEKSTYF